MLRDLFGNPFRPFPPKSEQKAWNQKLRHWRQWSNGRILKSAQSIYDEHAFDRLPDLANLLEEAGCEAPEILEHCRNQGVHARGCWVLDLLLGKK